LLVIAGLSLLTGLSGCRLMALYHLIRIGHPSLSHHESGPIPDDLPG